MTCSGSWTHKRDSVVLDTVPGVGKPELSMTGRHDPSDTVWAIIGPVLPSKPRRVARLDAGRVISGIFHTLETGAGAGRPLGLTGDVVGVLGHFGQAVIAAIDATGATPRFPRQSNARVVRTLGRDL